MQLLSSRIGGCETDGVVGLVVWLLDWLWGCWIGCEVVGLWGCWIGCGVVGLVVRLLD